MSSVLSPEIEKHPVSPQLGKFPFAGFLEDFDIWEYIPLDQGGRLAHLALIGSEKDADITREVRRPGFFDQWGPAGVWDALEDIAREKSVWLNRWYFLPPMAREFQRTKDRNILTDLIAFVERWWRDNPVPQDLPAYFSIGKYNWRDMQVAWRTLNLIWCYFLIAPELEPQTESFFRHVIEEHARVLLADFGEQPLHENNHQSHGALVMLAAGALFPEFPDSLKLVRRATHILEYHLEHAFYPDGNSIELCPGYFPFITSIFRDAWLLCDANGIEPPKRCRERLAQFRGILLAMAQPDGTMPPINDSSEVNTVPSLTILDRIFGADDKSAGSHCLHSSGQAVMRSGDWYSFLDAGDLMLWHWHGGKLGFHLWHGGEPIVVDSGVSDYDNPRRLSWYCTPEAHNTLLVDGRGDRDRDTITFSEKARIGAGVTAWESDARRDFATMEHGGFHGVRWVRHFLLLKTGAFVVVDRVLASEPHDYTWLFHFSPGEVASVKSGFQTRFARRNLALLSSIGENGRLAEGWVHRNGKDHAAQVAQFFHRAASTVQAFCFTPVEEGFRFVKITAPDPAGVVSMRILSEKSEYNFVLPSLNNSRIETHTP